MKDNFSAQSSIYAQFRPSYPVQLFDFLFDKCQNFEHAWDCATGNGQIAAVLAERFQQVEATDISENQLKNAVQKSNIRYQLGSAESPDFPDHSFDLVTVGQAAHWFNFEKFYPEMRRVIKPGGLLALVGYNLLRVDEPTEVVIEHFYNTILHDCWDGERHLVENAYSTIPFPLDEIAFPEMASTYSWTVEQLLGYLGTWSAVQHFIRKNGYHPIDETFVAQLKDVWPEGEVKTVRFPIFGRVGFNQ
ncbi:MAG: class I SAM-dependent methyltransferase [Phycisphaerae bacterium]|nr:class I SAM-dependent methyltransferase [Saprospiraceae bacterium]